MVIAVISAQVREGRSYPMSEIEIARIGANSIVEAAWIQGGLTVVAGLFAVFGGWFAYRGAVSAAERQVRLEELRHTARVEAYRFRVDSLADHLESSLLFCLSVAVPRLRMFRSNGGSCSMTVHPLQSVPDFSVEHWNDHALLGQAAVPAIHKVDEALRRYIAFQKEVVDGNLKTDSIPRHNRTVGPAVDEPDGSLSFRVTNAVEEDEALAREAVAAVKELRTIIDAPSLAASRVPTKHSV
jgi:hypothetical protein